MYHDANSHDSTITEVTIIALVTNTVTRRSSVAVIANRTAYRIYSIAAELNRQLINLYRPTEQTVRQTDSSVLQLYHMSHRQYDRLSQQQLSFLYYLPKTYFGKKIKFGNRTIVRMYHDANSDDSTITEVPGILSARS